jgi:tripartite-type tricarboxylate transporter receptor subunit TctC
VRALFALLILVNGIAFAQSYPTKPVRLIVTYPPGGSSDLMSRVYGAKLGELWGQQVIIESKPGAAGSIGMDYAGVDLMRDHDGAPVVIEINGIPATTACDVLQGRFFSTVSCDSCFSWLSTCEEIAVAVPPNG